MHPNWDHIFPSSSPVTNLHWCARDTILVIVPHSCRFGAGYKSNGRPRNGQPAPCFSMRGIVPQPIPPTDRTRVVREAHRAAYERETSNKLSYKRFGGHV